VVESDKEENNTAYDEKQSNKVKLVNDFLDSPLLDRIKIKEYYYL